jgi:hypothetical protein
MKLSSDNGSNCVIQSYFQCIGVYLPLCVPPPKSWGSREGEWYPKETGQSKCRHRYFLVKGLTTSPPGNEGMHLSKGRPVPPRSWWDRKWGQVNDTAAIWTAWNSQRGFGPLQVLLFSWLAVKDGYCAVDRCRKIANENIGSDTLMLSVAPGSHQWAKGPSQKCWKHSDFFGIHQPHQQTLVGEL